MQNRLSAEKRNNPTTIRCVDLSFRRAKGEKRGIIRSARQVSATLGPWHENSQIPSLSILRKTWMILLQTIEKRKIPQKE